MKDGCINEKMDRWMVTDIFHPFSSNGYFLEQFCSSGIILAS